MSLLRSVSASPCLRSAGVGFGLRTGAAGILSPSKSSFLVAGVRRSLATTSARFDALKSKDVDERASKGAEGLHFVDAAGAKAVKHDMLTHSDIPVVMGDWVLFHPVYSDNELRSVKILHRDPRNIKDKLANGLVILARKMFDLVSGYNDKKIPEGSTMSLEELRKNKYVMTEAGWLARILFLESIAGVPGMVAATIRHLHSLRRMKRDSGWIHTLLEEAENERMHLMTFMTLRKPSIFFRTLVLGAQGVFYNLFFASYLLSPPACHRFVGYLEEEAVKTYTHCIEAIESGHLPEWKSRPAPAIAIDYWRLPPNATMLDVIYAVRSDESTHRFVNHSLANLDHKSDVNPFAIREPDMTVKGVKYGFEREESAGYVRESRRIIREHVAHEKAEASTHTSS